MRARSVKPGFFTNDVLAEIDPLGRILFIGLWSLADREGRLEDRPKRIKAEVLPYDECDVDQLLHELEVRDFIVRYHVDGQALIQVTSFDKHQHVHKNEGPSTLPPPGDFELVHERNGAASGFIRSDPEQNETNPPGVFNPVSGVRCPDTSVPASPTRASRAKNKTDPGSEDVDQVYELFKLKVQPLSRLCPRKRIAARLDRFSAAELRQGIDHFAADPWWMENNATRGADWFFESDSRSEQFLLMKPRPADSPLAFRPRANGPAPGAYDWERPTNEGIKAADMARVYGGDAS